MAKLGLFVLLLCGLSLAGVQSVVAQPTGATIAQVDARAEVAAALFAASATQAAAEHSADQQLRAQRKQIEEMRARLRTGEAKLQTALAEAQESYIAALAARDRGYAAEIAVFRKSVQDIAATPQGAAALARFNSGDEVGALGVLDALRAANDAARKKGAGIESAAEGRRIAKLAREARTRGKLGTAEVMARFEEVTRLDPGVHWDWIELSRLYQNAGRLSDALRAANSAADTARNDRDRAVAQNELGNVHLAQGDGPGALVAYRKGLAIAEALATRDPANTQWQRDLSVSIDRIGNTLLAQGDVPGALAAYLKSLAIREALAVRDPANTEWQRDLSVSHNEIGDVLLAQCDRPGALAAYRKSQAIHEALAVRDPANAGWLRDLSVGFDRIGEVLLAQGDRPDALAAFRKSVAIRETLAARDPLNAEWQRDLVVSFVKLGEATGDASFSARALRIARDMQQRGIFAPRDAVLIDALKRRAEQ